MKKSMIIVMSLILVILSGCQSNSLPDTEIFPETKLTASFSESKMEPTESESESSDMTDESTEPVFSNEHNHSSEQENSSRTQSIPTNTNQPVINSEDENVTAKEPEPTPETKPSEKPQPSEESKPTPETTPEIETPPPEQTETAESVPPQETPPQPKSIYDYEFDIEAIRAELIALGEGMGLTHSGDLTPDNASWSTPVTASADFQGENLKRKLKDYVQSMPELITAYGGNPIQYFTIYAEPLGGGSYRFYFLY